MKFEDYHEIDDGDENVRPDPQRGLRIHSLYVSFKMIYEKNKFRKKTTNQAVIETFNRVAGDLNKHERETGVEIDDALFVKALFKKYGKDTYPGHLLGESAIQIYQEKLNEIFPYDRATLSKDYDAKLLKNLCADRGETEEETIDALRNAGVFSSRFIREWEKKRGRKV